MQQVLCNQSVILYRQQLAVTKSNKNTLGSNNSLQTTKQHLKYNKLNTG